MAGSPWFPSAILSAENARNPNLSRRLAVESLLDAMECGLVAVDEIVVERARALEARGLRPLDALHAACAEAGGCDFLVTTDDRMLRLLRRASPDLKVRPVDPLEFIRILEGIAS